jgi:menaquinone-9 beta-reductase
MDHALIEHCRGMGINVIQGLRIHGIHGNDDRGYYVYGSSATGQRALKARLVVGAFGKQSVLHRKLVGRTPTAARHLMALKLHIPGGCTPGRVELHMFPGGYVGLCEIEGGQTNLCLLTETAVFRHAACNYERFCQERLALNPLLGQRLDALRPLWQEVVAVANLTFGPQSRTVGSILMVGDAAASISPFCGDGMSMALRAGEIVAPLVHRFLAGDLAGQALRQAYEQQWRQEFSRRLRLGSILQQFFFKPFLGQAAMALLLGCPGLGQRLIRWTRGRPVAKPENTCVL